MKFCPYCGAFLVGGAVSFCAECGKALPNQKDTGKQARGPGRKAAGKPAQARKKKAPQACRDRSVSQSSTGKRRQEDESYDGYYDNVLPVDAGQQRDRMDPQLMKQVVLLVSGAVALIILSAVLMWLL